MNDTFFLTPEQDGERLYKLNADYRELREKIKEAEQVNVVSAFKSRKSAERQEFLTHLAILIGGPIASIVFIGGFWAGFASLGCVIVAFWLMNDAGSPLEIEDFDYQFYNHWDDWKDLERRRLDRDSDRKDWAERNAQEYDCEDKVSIEHEEYLENFAPAYPWDRSWLY